MKNELLMLSEVANPKKIRRGGEMCTEEEKWTKEGESGLTRSGTKEEGVDKGGVDEGEVD